MASPLQAKVASGAPLGSTHTGDWSTPTNLMFGLAWAAATVGVVRLKPTVTITSNFWLTNWAMSAAYSDASLGTIEGTGSVTPIEVAPSCAPLKLNSL